MQPFMGELYKSAGAITSYGWTGVTGSQLQNKMLLTRLGAIFLLGGFTYCTYLGKVILVFHVLRMRITYLRITYLRITYLPSLTLRHS